MYVWLDDVRNPKHFAPDPDICPEFPPLSSWIWVKTAQEAIDLLQKGTVIQISLDHDLGHGPTGYDVACWIEAHAQSGALPRLQWRVHSANTVGAARIRQALQSADRFWGQP